MTREEKKKETRRRLIEAAEELFKTKGYEETAVSEITDKAGVAKGTFFNYFQNKEQVFFEIQGLFFSHEIGKLIETPGPITPRLRSLMMDMFPQHSWNRVLTRAMFQCMMSSSNSLAQQQQDIMEMAGLLSPIYRLGQERGEYRKDVSPEFLSYLTLQTFFGALSLHALEIGEDELGQQLNITFDVFFSGIKA
ncbi:TetR/AcrR family transcriptional regulator [Paenibacillus turpanensis]|uniref:TetR/AcrR family transcriptional regulator n=1 Tax=Paenibacillus turpanensis TaxID=2689078 RepID=UPI00140C2E3D|nr:TetR/AcrR family transcriptional regulator [Paenibacillus turpanensis]